MAVFHDVFGYKPIIGMIHLSGGEQFTASEVGRGPEKVRRALEEITIYEDAGVDAVIVENYHGTWHEVRSVLQEVSTLSLRLKVGVNILPNEYDYALGLANQFSLPFVQLDYVAGRYVQGPPVVKGRYDPEAYYAHLLRFKAEHHLDKVVLGGVWPKYYTPIGGSVLEEDIREGATQAEAIVVTGKGTGTETPLDKVKIFKEVVGDHPLVIGAGVTLENVAKYLALADGVIVGSYFKKNAPQRVRTENELDKEKVKMFMAQVREIRGL